MQFTYRNPARATDPSATLAGAASLVVGARHYGHVRTRRPVGRAGGGPGGPLRQRGPLRRPAPGARPRGRAPPRPTAGRPGSWWTTTRWSIGPRPTAPGWAGTARTPTSWCRGWAAGWCSARCSPTPRCRWRPIPCPTDAAACTRCLSGCPTGAIVAPGVVDARRCLAWLVQAEGVFPVEHRVALGDRLYGCDDCQEVCPPSRRAGGEGVDAGQPDRPGRRGRSGAPTRGIRRLGRRGRAARQPTTPACWRGSGAGTSPGASRATCAATPSSCWATRARPTIPRFGGCVRQALADPDPLVRAHAVWAARRLGLGELVAGVAGDPDPLVRAELDGPDQEPGSRHDEVIA